MFNRHQCVSRGFGFGLTLVFLSLPARAAARIQVVFGGLFLPLFGLAGSAQQLTAQAADAITPRSELLHKIQQLRLENEQLKLLNQRTSELERENKRLRQLFGWQQQQHQWKLKLAKVVMRDPSNWWRTVQLDLGSRA